MSGRLAHRLCLVLVAASLALLGAACGGGGGGGGEGETVSTGSWVTDICGSLSTWQETVTSDTPDLSNLSDLGEAKTTIVDYLDRAATATRSLVDDVAAAGIPEVENGQAIATEFQQSLTSVQTSFEDAKSEIEGLSIDDPTTFVSDLRKVGATLTTAATAAGTAFQDLAAKYPAADLDAAFAAEDSCEGIG